MRKIDHIVVHCTATHQNATAEGILRYWREELGWTNPGYHYLILPDGSIHQYIDQKEIANGVRGYNAHGLHISYVGGIDKNGNPVDNRTDEQRLSMFNLLIKLTMQHPEAELKGHRDFLGVNKACPCFDVAEWFENHPLRLTT